MLDLRLGGVRDFRACDPRGVEFGPEGGKFARKVALSRCWLALLFQRLLLLDLRLGGLRAFPARGSRGIAFVPERG